MNIDPKFGVPAEEIACPGCGKSYHKCRKICATCDERVDCHKEYICDNPKLISKKEFLEM